MKYQIINPKVKILMPDHIKQRITKVYLYRKLSGLTSKQYYADDGRTFLRRSKTLEMREGIQDNWEKTNICLELIS